MPDEKLPTAEEIKKRLMERQSGPEKKEPDEDPGDKIIRPVKAKPRKKKFSQKLKEAMFSEDIGNGSVAEHLFFKILIPNTKQLLSNMANTAINMALGLDPKTRTIGSGNTHVANASLYRDRNFSRGTADYNARNRRSAVSDFEWDEETAADIYTQCMDILDRYPSLSLAEVYSIMGQQTLIQSTDRRWGWTDGKGIDLDCVDYNNKIWRVVFPPARPI